jgi:hypothetical protein
MAFGSRAAARSPKSAGEVYAFVEEQLHNLLDDVRLTDKGDFQFRVGSTVVQVQVREQKIYGPGPNTLVYMEAVLVRGAPPTPELFRHIALQAGDILFGTLFAKEDADGVSVRFGHSLLGDFLDTEEFQSALAKVAGTSDGLDDELVRNFGGRRLQDL